MRVGIFVAKREIRMEQPAAHDPFQSQLGAFHDDELSNDARIKLERHLRDCPDCEDTLKEIAYRRGSARIGCVEDGNRYHPGQEAGLRLPLRLS